MADEKEPNVHLSIVDQEGNALSNFAVVAPPGSAFVINGFHGSQTYEISPFDANLQVQFVGIESIKPEVPTKEEPEEAPAEKPAATTTKK